MDIKQAKLLVGQLTTVETLIASEAFCVEYAIIRTLRHEVVSELLVAILVTVVKNRVSWRGSEWTGE